SKLDWFEPGRAPHGEVLAWYRELIALRRARPELTDPRLGRVGVEFDEAARWLVIRRGRLRIVANLAGEARLVPLDRPPAAVLAASGDGVAAGDGAVTVPATTFTVIET